jgi:hypothetical protein
VRNKKRFDKKQTVGYEKIRKKKMVFCLDHPEKDLKCERLEKEKVRIDLIILFNLLSSKFKSVKTSLSLIA